MDLIEKIEMYVIHHIGEFHYSRIDKLRSMDLRTLLRRKNPYLFKAKNMSTPQNMVMGLASAFVSSAEETLFGEWLEHLAIFVAEEVYGGRKSTSEGIDIEMDVNGVHFAISVKSGPNWSNSSSRKKMLDNFVKAKRIYRSSGNYGQMECIEGICYGRESNPDKGTHIRLCGEDFWAFISGRQSLYLDIIEPLGANAMSKNTEYEDEYNRMITRFTKEFSNLYCLDNGDIDWKKIVTLNSSSLKNRSIGKG